MSEKKNEKGPIRPPETALARWEKYDDGPGYLKKALEDLTWLEAKQWLLDLADEKPKTMDHTNKNHDWRNLLFFLIQRAQIGNYKDITPKITLVPLQFTHVRSFVRNAYDWNVTVAIAISIHNDHQLSKWYNQAKQAHDLEKEEKHKAKEAKKQRVEQAKKEREKAEQQRIQIMNYTLAEIQKKTGNFN